MGDGVPRLGLVVCLIAMVVAPPVRAQDFEFRPTVQWQGHAELTTTDRGGALLIGGGVNVPAGYYVRIGLDAAGGLRSERASGGAASNGMARLDLTARFLLDPFAEQRIGWYGGGGLAALHDGSGWRPYLTLVAGREGPTAGRWRSALELSVGGGVRLGAVLRRARANGR